MRSLASSSRRPSTSWRTTSRIFGNTTRGDPGQLRTQNVELRTNWASDPPYPPYQPYQEYHSPLLERLMKKLRVLVLFLACGATALAAQVTDRSWSPGVRKAPEQSPPLSPEEEMKHFVMP